MNSNPTYECISCEEPLALEPGRSDLKVAWCETTICRISGKGRGKEATVFWCKPCADVTFPQNVRDLFAEELPCAA